MNDAHLLNLREAAHHIGQSTRWLRRHWAVDLVRSGVVCYRVPKGSVKGRLMFEKASLDTYLEECRIEAGSGPF
jgi:hypothetical protein